MHTKDIKSEVRKQLKKQYPNWKNLSKKQKKEIAQKVVKEVAQIYDFKKEIKTPSEELLGIAGQTETSGIMKLKEMGEYIESYKKSKIFDMEKYRNASYIRNPELKAIDNLLDNEILDNLLSYKGYTPIIRKLRLYQLLRAELLKVIKYPEISYRKFCTEEYIGLERKENRTFLRLPLNKKKMIDHTELSQFRSRLTFSQVVNLLVYILYYFQKSGVWGSTMIHSVDSTELPIDRATLLASLEIKGEKIRIYEDLDCDCGKRRNKRDKSIYVVGYRMHTLTVINVKTGHAYPLISLLAPANHHDSHFLEFVIKLGQAMGLEIQIVVADEAYHDNEGRILKETGVRVVTAPRKNVLLPENVDVELLQVTHDDLCEIPMSYIGAADGYHEFKCGAERGECPRSEICSMCRLIPFDCGKFQSIPSQCEDVLKIIELRKTAERPFNLLKKREGLENVRVRGQSNIIARTGITMFATLLLDLVGTRSKKKRELREKQLKLPLLA